MMTFVVFVFMRTIYKKAKKLGPSVFPCNPEVFSIIGEITSSLRTLYV